MPVMAHYHVFTSVNGGYQCQNCSAFFSQSILASNKTNSKGHRFSIEEELNFSWKKSGGT